MRDAHVYVLLSRTMEHVYYTKRNLEEKIICYKCYVQLQGTLLVIFKENILMCDALYGQDKI